MLKQEQSSAQLQNGEKHPVMGAVSQKKLWSSTKSVREVQKVSPDTRSLHSVQFT